MVVVSREKTFRGWPNFPRMTYPGRLTGVSEKVHVLFWPVQTRPPRPFPVVNIPGQAENNRETNIRGDKFSDPKYMYLSKDLEFSKKVRQNFIPELEADLTGAGLEHDWDIRDCPRIEPRTSPGKYHMIIHVHERLVFFGGFVFVFCFVDCV